MPTVIDVAVTGTAWVGGGIRSIDNVLRQIFSRAVDEVSLTAYSIGPNEERVFVLLREALEKGIRVTFVCNRLQTQPQNQVARLTALQAEFGHFRLFDYCPDGEHGDLHAKVVVADRRVALVGSSNLSYRGFVTNHEVAVLINGTEAELVAKTVDRLFSDPACRPLGREGG